MALVDVRLHDLTLFEQRYRLTLRLNNPNNRDLPVQQIYYEVFFEGERFAEGASVAPFTLPALGESRVDVIVSTSLLRSARHAASLLQSGRESLAYEMRGYAIVDLPLAGRVPFSDSGKLELPPLPQ